jgi:catechol 2,3-dioxygenase-like lactoylglutathione lyase family enzyme
LQCWPAWTASTAPSTASAKLPERDRERVRQAYWQALDDAINERDAKDRLQALIDEFDGAGYTAAGDNRHAPANTPGIRHIACAVEEIDTVVAGPRARGAELVGELERCEDSYRLCYVRGPDGIIIELAEKIG